MERETPQKKVLRKELSKVRGFFDAADFFSRIEKSGIGIATVYRFLDSMVKKGELHDFNCDGRKVYSTSSKNHIHFKCESCGDVSHPKMDSSKLKSLVSIPVCHFQLDLSGLCVSCK